MICDQVSGRYLPFYDCPEAIPSSSKAHGLSSGTPALPAADVAGGELSRCLGLGPDQGAETVDHCVCAAAFPSGPCLLLVLLGTASSLVFTSPLPRSLVLALEVGVARARPIRVLLWPSLGGASSGGSVRGKAEVQAVRGERETAPSCLRQQAQLGVASSILLLLMQFICVFLENQTQLFA